MHGATAMRTTAEQRLLPAYTVSMSLIGTFNLSLGDRVAVVGRRKSQALLAYLALSPQPAESRERLCGLLWSETDQKKAQTSLRQILHGVREVLDDLSIAGLHIGRNDVRIEKHAFDVDVLSVLHDAERGDVHPLLLQRTRLTEHLLSDLIDIDPAFRAWLLVQREVLKQRLESLLEAALARTRTLAAVKPIATALCNLDPSNEMACRRLMQAYAEQGDVSGALKAYKSLWELLDEEYDTEPSPQTQDLVVRIKRGDPVEPISERALPGGNEPLRTARSLLGDPAAVPSNQAPDSEVHSILLVPEFENGGVREHSRYLVRALRQDLIAKLVRFREWTVLDGDVSDADFIRTFEGKSARYFKVGAVVGEDDACVSLTLTIKSLPEGRYIWSETYRPEADRWLAAQQKMVGRIALALNVHLSADRLISTARHPDVSLGTYDRWLRGQHLLFSWSAVDRARAATLFQAIIADEPQFAPVYGSLVQLENSEHIVLPGVMRTKERHDRALAFAKRAVQLDPLDSRTHLALAWSFAMSGRFELAELEFELAMDLNEHDPWTLISAAQGLSFSGRTEEAGAIADRALSLNLKPSLPHWGYQVGIRFLRGDYQGCIEAALNANDVISNLPAWHAAALAHLGRDREAFAAGRRLVDKVRANWQSPAPPTEEAIASWVLQSFPIRRDDDWAVLRDGMARAQLPVPDRRQPLVP
jgi:DNA-binding SARP family transcriptional activator/TolB-like protein